MRHSWKYILQTGLLRSLTMTGLLLMVHNSPTAQPSINYQHLTTREGLNDNFVNDLCEDKYGFMWIATLGALNRFDGTRVDRFMNIPGDTTSPYRSIPFAIVCDVHGRLWIGYSEGLVEYQYATQTFRRVHALKNIGVFRMMAGSDGKLYIPHRKGLFCFNPSTEQLEPPVDSSDSLVYARLHDTSPGALMSSGDSVFVGYSNSILAFHTGTKQGRMIEIPTLKGSVDALALDSAGHFWIGCRATNELVSCDANGIVLSRLILLFEGHGVQTAYALAIRADGLGNIWVVTNQMGLIQYMPQTQTYIHHHATISQKAGISSNHLKVFYQDRRGLFWLGTVNGVDYFDPDENLFEIIHPFRAFGATTQGRGVSEDTKGNLWLTTSEGITRYIPSSQSYTSWQNTVDSPAVMYSNSSRAIIEDNHGSIWFVTSAGVNKLDPVTGRIQFLTAEDGLPPGFYLSVTKDAQNNIWFGTRDNDGLYYYVPPENKIYSIVTHEGLRQFAGKGGRYVYEDSRQRLWIGFNGNGLGMYNRTTGQTRYWYHDATPSDTTIIGNLINDIKEDHHGVIWISTFNGITGIDTDNNRFTSFDHTNGLRSNIAGPLAVDDMNRLWVGMSNGLVLIDSSRSHFTYFNESDGLPNASFTEHPACYDSHGYIIMPTSIGYIRFNPLLYQSQPRQLDFYQTAFHVYEKERPFPTGKNGQPIIRLSPDENFFTITLGTLNFHKPEQTWYAYQLIGFDKQWRYTQDAKAVFTNVPGGTYTFAFKASTDPRKWDMEEKHITIHIATVFYKTFWFWALLFGFSLVLLYQTYKNRLNAQRKVHQLMSKSQLLEKEKAVVQYESLKQQLNPHFLFNSLTSLSSLIHTNQKIAAEFLHSLSKTYRYILKSSENETVTLGEELKFAETYVRLQQTRFQTGLQVRFDIDESHYHKKIVPVTIQNLLENAIKHNIIDEDLPLCIDVSVKGPYLTVRNNLQRKKFVETSNQQGISNLKTLYAYLSDAHVQVIEEPDAFIVEIPLL